MLLASVDDSPGDASNDERGDEESSSREERASAIEDTGDGSVGVSAPSDALALVTPIDGRSESRIRDALT